MQKKPKYNSKKLKLVLLYTLATLLIFSMVAMEIWIKRFGVKYEVFRIFLTFFFAVSFSYVCVISMNLQNVQISKQEHHRRTDYLSRIGRSISMAKLLGVLALFVMPFVLPCLYKAIRGGVVFLPDLGEYNYLKFWIPVLFVVVLIFYFAIKFWRSDQVVNKQEQNKKLDWFLIVRRLIIVVALPALIGMTLIIALILLFVFGK